MPLSEEKIREFKKIYEKKFGERINDKKAEELAANFLNLLIAVYKPIDNKNHEAKS